MDFSIFARQVSLSDRTKNDANSVEIFFLGLIGEIGSIVSERKKTLLIGGDNRSRKLEKLSRELGDSLWYVTAIALKYELDLRRDIVQTNIAKVIQLKICTPESRIDIEAQLLTFPNQLPSNFNEYQDIAWRTAAEKLTTDEDELLARLIRKSAQLMRFFADNRSNTANDQATKLEGLLGDLLWYIAVYSMKNNLLLNDVADENYKKTVDRTRVDGEKHSKRLDSKNEPEERFPEKMSFLFRPIAEEKIEVLFENQDILVGDSLDDNSEIEDGYRYHDSFHLAFCAILTWSPVLRKMLRSGEGKELNSKKFHRVSSREDRTQDGARAQIVEEAIAKIAHSHAFEIDENKLLSKKENVSTELLEQIDLFTRNLEVAYVKAWEWEIAIIEACKIFVQLKQNNGGRVKLNLAKRQIQYEEAS